MKTYSLLLVALATTVLTFFSCRKEDNPIETNTVTDAVLRNPNFSLLAEAVNRAGLAATLSTSNNITVFAPDNEAFQASGITSDVISSLSADTLASILQYHIVAARVGSSDVPESDAVNTLLNRNLYASRNTNGVFVNGVAVKQADIQTDNGIIHVISRVLVPPTQTIAQVAASNPDFSILLAAVVRAGLAGTVSGPGKFTVFAPTNAAFNSAGFPNAAAVSSADEETVSTVVGLHVLPTNVFASDLINNTNATSVQGSQLLITTSPAAIKVAASANPASAITTADIVTTNGVIHVIDRVILP